jgi:hypothetical protein
MEIVVAGMTEGPHAAWTGEVENVAARRRLLRDDARHQTEAMHLADDGVFGDADLTANLRRRDPLFPQLRQKRDALGRPRALNRHNIIRWSFFDPFQ